MVALLCFTLLYFKGGRGGGERGGHPDPEITGAGARSSKILFRPFVPQFGLKITGGRAPPLDRPLSLSMATSLIMGDKGGAFFSLPPKIIVT